MSQKLMVSSMRICAPISLLAALFLAVLAFAVPGPDPASAQVSAAQPQAPLAVPAPARSAQAMAAGPFDRAWLWMLERQRELTTAMTSAVRRLQGANFWSAAAQLGIISFLYGVFHAAGPGHGKFVISSYALANARTLRRGVTVSFMAAFVQAMSAIAIVGILALLFKATSLEIRRTEAWLETVSWGLIAVLGAWLLWSRMRHLLARPAAAAGHVAQYHPAAGHHAHHDHHLDGDHDHRSHKHHKDEQRTNHAGHGHGHGHGCTHSHAHDHGVGCTDHGPAVHARAGGHHAHDHHNHQHHQHHGHHPHAHGTHGAGDACDTCGHAHAPSPAELQGAWSWRQAWSLAFAVGVRPCTGAIAVLLFSLGTGLLAAGIFATFTMAIGTALTVSVLATLAVTSRDLAARLGGRDSVWAGRVQTAAGIAGSLLVLVLGTSFFIASLSSTGPL